MSDSIRIRGARTHNLRNIDVTLPHRAITVITGPSGSGKSSLAFDTIYAEGQRRYVESLSAYARQFLERMPRPDVDHIEGLAPAVAIEQKNATRTSRSTVGTATEVYDYLRLLWARIGRVMCPRVRPRVASRFTRIGGRRRDRARAHGRGGRARHPMRRRVSPPARARRSRTTSSSTTSGRRASCASSPTGSALHLDDVVAASLDLTKPRELLVVVDRLAAADDARGRLVDALATAFREGEGDATVTFRGRRQPTSPALHRALRMPE